MPDPRIRYRLRDFALQSLADYLPEDFARQGELNADIELDLPAAGPNGQVQVDAGPGVLRIRDADQWHDFPYQTLALNSRLRPERVDSELRFAGGELGDWTCSCVSTRVPKPSRSTASSASAVSISQWHDPSCRWWSACAAS